MRRGWAAAVAAVMVGVGVLASGVAQAAPAASPPWSVVPTPRPGPSSALSSVSCASPTSCFAVGYIRTRIHDLPLIEHFDGTTWSVTPGPKAGTSSALRGVSCVSASFCVAVGYVYDGSNTQTLVETWRGTRWAVTPSANVGTRLNLLTSVSCVTPKSCVAVGYYESPGESDQTLAEVWDGSHWSVTSSPNPGAIDNDLWSVSCSTKTRCFAVGATQDFGTDALTEQWNGSTWSVVPTPSIEGYSGLEGVSCSSPSSCVAVGSQTDAQSLTLVETWDGAAWTITPSPNPSPIEGTGGNQLRAVSCTDSTHCVAVGGYEPNAAQNGKTLTLVETFDGSGWTVSPSHNDPGAVVNLPYGASCIQASSCVAVGAVFNHHHRPATLALVNDWPAGGRQAAR